MSTVMKKMPVIITQKGRRVFLTTTRHPAGESASVVNAPNRREVLTIAVGDRLVKYTVEVTVEGVMSAFAGMWVEPFGDITMWTAFNAQGRRWFYLKVDRDGVLLQFSASGVVDVLAEITVASCTEPAGRIGGAA